MSESERRCGLRFFVQVIDRENLPLRAGIHNGHLATVTQQKHLPIGRYRRGEVRFDSLFGPSNFPNLAIFRIEGSKDTAVLNLVQNTAVNQRRREVGKCLLVPPQQMLFGLVALSSSPHCDQAVFIHAGPPDVIPLVGRDVSVAIGVNPAEVVAVERVGRELLTRNFPVLVLVELLK